MKGQTDPKKAAEEAAMMILISPSPSATPMMKHGKTCPHCGKTMSEEGEAIDDEE